MSRLAAPAATKVVITETVDDEEANKEDDADDGAARLPAAPLVSFDRAGWASVHSALAEPYLLPKAFPILPPGLSDSTGGPQFCSPTCQIHPHF